MLPIQFTYLFGAALFLIPWFLIFYFRKDLRSILIWIGLISIPLSLIAEYYWWTRDWWEPLTVTNTRTGIEDVLLSFVSVGVSASLYLVVTRKQFVAISRPTFKRIATLCLIALVCLLLFVVLFQSGINSFISTLIIFSIATILLLCTKPGLAIPALINGGLTVVLVIPVFLAMFAVTPDYVEQTWMIHNLLGIYPLGIPIEDILFYFIGGALSFSAFPYITDSQLVKLLDSKRQ